MELEQYHIRIPKYLMDRIRSEVVERWGYEVKGGIGLIINETLEEKFRMEKVGTHTHTNTYKVEEQKGKKELAQTNPEQLKINSIINNMLSDIYHYASKPREDRPKSIISTNCLEKVISKKYNVYDKRSIRRYIDMLLTNGIIEDPEFNEFKKIISYTLVNPKIEKEIVN